MSYNTVVNIIAFVVTAVIVSFDVVGLFLIFMIPMTIVILLFFGLLYWKLSSSVKLDAFIKWIKG